MTCRSANLPSFPSSESWTRYSCTPKTDHPLVAISLSETLCSSFRAKASARFLLLITITMLLATSRMST